MDMKIPAIAAPLNSGYYVSTADIYNAYSGQLIESLSPPPRKGKVAKQLGALVAKNQQSACASIEPLGEIEKKYTLEI